MTCFDKCSVARDVIAEWLTDGGFASGQAARDFADSLIARFQISPESVRLELAAKLNPWRPISEAPTYRSLLLHNGGKTEDWIGIISKAPYVSRYAPTHFQHLPAPPSEDKL